MAELAMELARLNLDLIVASNTPRPTAATSGAREDFCATINKWPMILPLFSVCLRRNCLAPVKFRKAPLISSLLGTHRMIIRLLANYPNQLLRQKITAFPSNQNGAACPLSSS
jgi:hypothetical protein